MVLGVRLLQSGQPSLTSPLAECDENDTPLASRVVCVGGRISRDCHALADGYLFPSEHDLGSRLGHTMGAVEHRDVPLEHVCHQMSRVPPADAPTNRD